jgi:formamidase
MSADQLEYRTVVKVDPLKDADQQEGLMNRWHPDIPAYAIVKPGEVFKVECHEWTGGQIHNTDDADDVKDVDLTKIHNLSGPIAIEGTKPGDVLVVDILDVTPFPHLNWGYTGVFERE